jgi:hypothetical protein
MNLSELQAFLEDSSWDDEPEPAHPADGLPAHVEMPKPEVPIAQNSIAEVPVAEVPVEEMPAREDQIPTLKVERDLQSMTLNAPVKLVPRAKEDPAQTDPVLRAADSVRERLMEVEMAQKMGYLLCKCTWPPQVMVLTGTDHVYRCRRCSRVREM